MYQYYFTLILRFTEVDHAYDLEILCSINNLIMPIPVDNHRQVSLC